MATDRLPVAGPATVGIDVGGTKVLGCVLDPAVPGRVVRRARTPTPRGGDALADAIAGLVRSLTDEPVAVGVGIAGLVDRAGVVRFSPNLPGVIDVDLPAALRARLGVPIVVVNDVSAALVAEHRVGAAAGHDDVVLVALGTGIGGGLVAGGSVQLGAAGFAGEPGHLVVDPQGPPCPCGRRGCWERYASGSALGARASAAVGAGRASRVLGLAGSPDAVRGEHVTAAAAEGDAEATAILEDFAWWVALGIANLVAVLDPAVVVVGGGLVATGDLLLDPVRAAFAGLVMGVEHRPPVAIVPAALGPDAGAVGAALLATDPPA